MRTVALAKGASAPTRKRFSVSQTTPVSRLADLEIRGVTAFGGSDALTPVDCETEWSFEARDGKTMIQRGLPTAELRREHLAGLPNAFARVERAIEK